MNEGFAVQIIRNNLFLIQEDYFKFSKISNLDSNSFMVTTMLDSSKIESLKILDFKLKCSMNQKCLISAAIIISDLEDLCYSIGKLRDLAIGRNIIISIVVRRDLELRLLTFTVRAGSRLPKSSKMLIMAEINTIAQRKLKSSP